jgi:hypothetical protein
MKGDYTNKIEDLQLIKVEKKFNGHNQKYYYNIKFSEIDELLIIETEEQLDLSMIGLIIKYKLNSEGIIEEFNIE